MRCSVSTDMGQSLGETRRASGSIASCTRSSSVQGGEPGCGTGPTLAFCIQQAPLCALQTPLPKALLAAEQPEGREQLGERRASPCGGGLEVFPVITLLINCWPLAGVRAGCIGGCLLPPFLPSLSSSLSLLERCWLQVPGDRATHGTWKDFGTGGLLVLLQGLGL